MTRVIASSLLKRHAQHRVRVKRRSEKLAHAKHARQSGVEIMLANVLPILSRTFALTVLTNLRTIPSDVKDELFQALARRA